MKTVLEQIEQLGELQNLTAELKMLARLKELLEVENNDK